MSKEADQTVIVIEGGMVVSIYSTIPKDKHVIELLDLDCAAQESTEEEEAMRARINEISKDPGYREVY